MNNEPIVFERTYSAPIAKVWKALTNKDDMKQWYFDMSDFKPVVGFEFTFVGENEGKKFVHLCKITEVIPERKLKHSWRYEGFEGNSFVTWELFRESENKTRVKLTHEGLETFPQSKDFVKSNFVAGWTAIVGTMLTNFVEVSDIIKTIEINATPEQLWQVLVSVDMVTNWAQGFSGGTVVESDFKEGSSVVWKTSAGEIGASGTVAERIENRRLVLTYIEDGDQPSDTYTERFDISSKGNKTVLTVTVGPLAKMWAEKHEPLWDEVMVKISELAS